MNRYYVLMLSIKYDSGMDSTGVRDFSGGVGVANVCPTDTAWLCSSYVGAHADLQHRSGTAKIPG